MFNIIKKLFTSEPAKNPNRVMATKKRVRSTDGRFARRIVINNMDGSKDYIYRPATSGVKFYGDL